MSLQHPADAPGLVFCATRNRQMNHAASASLSDLVVVFGTDPAHPALQVLSHASYDGKVADIWSCGVMLYIMLTGAPSRGLAMF